MIEIVKENSKTKKKSKKPHYILKYSYMIGDANGNQNEIVELSINNPFIEAYVTALTKLKPIKGRWGIILTCERLKTHFEENQITKEEYELLLKVFQGNADETETEQYLYEFEEGIRSECHYSFLVFQGVTLTYVDEYGEKFKTRFVK